MDTINEHSIIVLNDSEEDIPEDEVGTVIHVHERAYEVEFIIEGSSVVKTLLENQIRLK